MLPHPSGLDELARTLRVLLDPDAATDEVAWRRASSEAVADLLRADQAYIQVASAPSLYVGTGIDDATFGALEREFAETSAGAVRYRDPEMERLHRLGRVRAGSTFTPDSVSRAMGVRVEETRIYREVCVPAGMEDFVGLSAASSLGDVMLWVSRRRGRRPLAADGLPLLEALEPAFLASVRALARSTDRWPSERALSQRFGLTSREAQVALRLARGASEKRVARALGISVHTARRHTEKVFVKLGVNARGQVAAVLLTLPG